MKKLLLILFCLPLITVAQQTYVPDDNFEAYLEANNMGNAISNDDYVTTENINTVIILDVNNNFITDLTGIEDFTALTNLECHSNQLTSLDVSQNTALTILRCDDNQLTSLDVSSALMHFWCDNNQLTSLDVSAATALIHLDCANNQITSLDVSNNTDLTGLWCHYNQLTSLDVSQNTALTGLWCRNNQLTSFDIRNGNNTNFTYFNARGNPNLNCIDVDDTSYSTANWFHDAEIDYSEDCSVK